MKSHLHIQTAVRNGITYLKQCYYSPPFKVANITEDKPAGPLHLMLMSSSPGILDGDDYQLKIDIEENAHLHLHSQSYQRLFNMKQGARQKMEASLQKNATLIYIPHPTVPHKKSMFTTYNKIYLEEENRLILGELLTCGRKLNGEHFDFIKYHSVTEIYIHGKLVIKENWLVQPGVTDVQAIGQWEGYTHQASLMMLDNRESACLHYDAINHFLLQQQDLTFGISTLPCNGLIVRILGYKAEQLFNCLNTIAAIITASDTGVAKNQGRTC